MPIPIIRRELSALNFPYCLAMSSWNKEVILEHGSPWEICGQMSVENTPVPVHSSVSMPSPEFHYRNPVS